MRTLVVLTVFFLIAGLSMLLSNVYVLLAAPVVATAVSVALRMTGWPKRKTDDSEYANENIADAKLSPLSCFAADKVDAEGRRAVVFHCKSGMRTKANAARLAACGATELYYLDGGIEAWKAAGFRVRAG